MASIHYDDTTFQHRNSKQSERVQNGGISVF
jgi:hypothetical protein